MKTRIVLSFIAAFLMQFTIVSADNYTDGLTKLMNSEAIAIVNSQILQTKSAPNVNADSLRNKFKTDALELLAGHYRKNMTEKDFNDMVSFFMQPEVLSAQKRVVSAFISQKSTEKLALQVIMINIGVTPQNLKEPDCDPKLKKELLSWLEINGAREALKATCDAVVALLHAGVPDNISEEEKAMMMKKTDVLSSFLKKNMDACLLDEMVGKVDMKDLLVLKTIENMPFYESYKKANQSAASDIAYLITKFMDDIKKN